MLATFQRNSCNIVGHNMLRMFGHSVGIYATCWIKFENGQNLHATFWMLHDAVLVWPGSHNIVALGHAC